MKILNQVKPDLASSNVSQNYSNKPNNIASKHRDLKEYSGHCRKSSDKRKGQMEAAIIGVKFDVKPRKSIFHKNLFSPLGHSPSQSLTNF